MPSRSTTRSGRTTWPDNLPVRARHDVMGMPVTVDVRDAGVGPAALEEAFADLRRVDRLFSTYRADSEVSRIDRGDLRPEDAGPEGRVVLGVDRRAAGPVRPGQELGDGPRLRHRGAARRPQLPGGRGRRRGGAR